MSAEPPTTPGTPNRSGQPSSDPPDGMDDHLAREIALTTELTGKVGIAVRRPGLLNIIAYWFQRVVGRLLVWYTRPLHEYQSHVTHSLNILQARVEAPKKLALNLDNGIRQIELNVDAAVAELRARQAELEKDFQQQTRLIESNIRALGNAFPASVSLSPKIHYISPIEAANRGLLDLPFGINAVGHATSEKGVGEAMRASLRSVQAANVPYCVTEFVDPGSRNIENTAALSDGNPYVFNLVHMNADQLSLFAAKNRKYLSRRYNIGYWNWELASFPWDFYGKFRHLDEVWVPSTFTRESVEKISPIPVTYIPYSINPNVSAEPQWTRERLHLPKDAFVFLFIFDFQSYVTRKNPAGVIQAFKRAFGERSDVFLLLKSSHGDYAPEQVDALRQMCGENNARLYDEVIPREALNALVGMCDGYVSLHRSEGFGLTMAEAMNLGKPVIATEYSANTDFMTAANSFLVRYRLVEIEEDCGPYSRGYQWADPDLDHAAELMRQVVADPAAARKIAEKGREDVQRKLHPSAVGELIKSRLEQISASISTKEPG